MYDSKITIGGITSMWAYIAVAAAALVTKALHGDSVIREEVYSKPLATMPGNVDALAKEMIAEATKGTNLNPAQLLKIETDIYKMMSEGAVAQRNFEMDKTRGEISYIGHFLSWFMKQQGMTYEQIDAKYKIKFADDEKMKHKQIIESASRTNKNLVEKFSSSLVSKIKGPAPTS